MPEWTQLSEAWRACIEQAWTAYCAGSIPVGAAVTDADGRILAKDRNRSYERDCAPTQVQVSPLSHAELNVLAALDYAGIDPHPCVLYASTEPCPMCLGALYMSGVRELRYAARDPYAGSVNLLRTTAYLNRKSIRVIHPQSLELEIILTALSTEFALGREPRAGAPVVLNAWRSVLPAGVALGEELFRSRWASAGGFLE